MTLLFVSMKARFFRLQTLRWLLASALVLGISLQPLTTTAQLVQQWSYFLGTTTYPESVGGGVRLGANRFFTSGVWGPNLSPDPTEYRPYFEMSDANGTIVYQRAEQDSSFLGISPAGLSVADKGDLYIPARGYDSLGNIAALLLRYDSLGNALWRRWLPGRANNNDGIIPWSLPNGVLLSAGRFGRGGRRRLLRYDGDGRLQWERIGPGSSAGFSLTTLTDGSYLWLTHDPYRVPGPTHTYYDYDLRLIRFSAAGDSLSSVYLSEPGFDYGQLVKATSDGGVVILSKNSIPPFNTPQRGLILKLDAQGQEQWRYMFTVASGNNDSGASLSDVQELTNGRYLILSGEPRQVAELIPPVSGNVASLAWAQPLPAYGGRLLLDNDPAGTLRLFGTRVSQVNLDTDTWRAKYTGVSAPTAPVNYCALPPGTPAASFQFLPPQADSLRFSLDVAATTPGPRYAEISRIDWDWGDGTPADSGRAVTHRFASHTPVRVRCTVTNNLFCASSLDLFPFGPLTALAEEHARAAAIAVFPNPSADGRFTLRLPDDGAAAPPGARLTVCDALGRVLSQLPAASPQTRLDLSQQPPGVYLLRLTWPDGSTVSKKLVRW